MIDHSNYSCDKCIREFSRHCKHCLHTAEKPPTKFKRKKTGVQTPEYRRPALPPNPNLGWQPTKSSGTKPPKPPTSGSNAQKTGSQVPPQHNPPPMPPIKPAKVKENKTMYGLKLYIPFEDLDTYIHEHIEDKYKDHTFIPVKVEVNELNCDIEISLVSANPIESDGVRYKLDLNTLPKENQNDQPRNN